MATFRELKQQIKFSLANLVAENAFHEFESVCRNFCRQRVGLNVLPATGPVSAGGDQGRDFESYQVIDYPDREHGNRGRMIWKRAAFACTVQQDRIPDKIKADIAKIAEGQPVDLVYFFSVSDVPVAMRHGLQDWANSTFSLHLEIFDGEALSEALTDHDLFWIAEEFLHVPAELFPSVEDIDYARLKEKWASAIPEFPNYGELHEVRGLARRALLEDSLAQDLPFWINKLNEFAEIQSTPPEFERKVLFEIIALRMRGMGDLIGWEASVRRFFDLLSTIQSPNEADDAAVVCIYAYGAAQDGGAELSPHELEAAWDSVRLYCSTAFQRDPSKLSRALLLQLKGFLLLVDPYERDLNNCLETWIELAGVIHELPLFPLERFTEIVATAAPVLGGYSPYDELLAQTDQLLSERVGSFAVADKCRTRAVLYYENAKPIQALREFHRAKVNWFAEETLRGSLLAMLMIAELYRDLRLFQAAKYYSLVALYIAELSQEPAINIFVPRALISLLQAEYLNGEWGHFFLHADLGMRALGAFAPDLGDPASASIWKQLIFYPVTASAITAALGEPQNVTFARSITDEWQSDEFGALLTIALETWSKLDRETLIQKIKAEFSGIPFAHAEKERVSSWAACGIDWRFTWSSGLEEDSAAEQLISVLQILSAELADRDMYLLSMKADVAIVFGSGFGITQRPSSAHDTINWSITLPLPDGKMSSGERHQEIAALATSLIVGLSVLPEDKVHQQITSLFEEGLTSKVLLGNSFEIVARAANDADLYERLGHSRMPASLMGVSPDPHHHSALAWNNSLLAEYDEEEEKQRVERRYKFSIVPLKQTLLTLKQDEGFRRTVRALRGKGWKDWHILQAMLQVGVNHRVHLLGARSPKEVMEVFMEEASRVETSESITLTADLFTEESLQQGLNFSLPSTLMGLGLVLRTNLVNFGAISRFLGDRMRYWEIDVAHEAHLPTTD